MTSKSLLLLGLVIILAAISVQSAHAESITHDLTVTDGTYTSTGNVTISSGVKITLIRSTWNIPGGVTSAGSNTLILQKSSIVMTSSKKLGFVINAQGGQVNISGSKLISKNSYKYYQFNKCSSLYINNTLIDGFGVPKGTVNTISSLLTAPSPTISGIHMNNVGKETVISDITGLSMSNVTLTNIVNDTTLLTFRDIVGGSVSGVSYTLTKPDVTTSTISIRVEGCKNLVLNKLNCVGMVNVNTPHFFVVWTAPGDAQPSVGTVVKNSYFYGGGNDVAGGSGCAWSNDTFSTCVDATEWWWLGNTIITDCRFVNMRSTEINLQSSYTDSDQDIQLTFTRCSFNKGLVDMDDGYAKLTNCTFPNGLVMKDMGNNNGILEHAGVIYQFWNYTSYRVGLESTWVNGTTWYVDHNFALTPNYSLNSPNIFIQYVKPTTLTLYDDQASFWTTSSGGTGSINISVAQQTGTVYSGKYALKYQTVAGTKAWVEIYHNYSPTQNWSGFGSLSIWWYGQNTGAVEYVHVLGPDWVSGFGSHFVDNFKGWKKVTLPLSSFTSTGSPSWADVKQIQISTATSTKTTWYLDDVTLSSP